MLVLVENLIYFFCLGPGPSSCTYLGSVDSGCNFKPIAVKDLPAACSSFFFERLTIDSYNDVFQYYTEHDNGNLSVKQRIP